MNRDASGVHYEGSAANRLWHKSAIGRLMSEDMIFLTNAEMLFCNEHRNIDLPSENWITECLKLNPDLIEEYTILESLRKPGNKIMLSENSLNFNFNIQSESWGLRWPSDHHPRNEKPISEIRWFHSSCQLNIKELYQWCENVTQNERIAEVLIVDNELAVVTYRIQILNPKGDIPIPKKDDYFEINQMQGSIKLSNGNIFMPHDGEWAWENIGIPYSGGRIIDEDMQNILNYFISEEGGEIDISTSIKLDLINRGLHPRPGFKYGSKWRCYDTALGEDHAPWLVVHPNNGPINWEEACLSSRLAAGVNKKWLYPIKNDIWNYISITRPPADSRWNNPTKR